MINNLCVWMTGLSGAGKTTIAHVLKKSIDCYILDGDDLRTGLNDDLGFSLDHRQENLRRVAHVARILANAGILPVVTCISPLLESRDFARSLFPAGGFIEVYIATTLDVCEERDPKGLYRRVREGSISNFTGVDSPYHVPECSEVTVYSGEPVDEAVQKILAALPEQTRTALHTFDR